MKGADFPRFLPAGAPTARAATFLLLALSCWLAPARAAAQTPQPAPGDIVLEGMEVLQVIQDLRNSIPLVAEKPTLVRAYVQFVSEHPITVLGELTVKRLDERGEVAEEIKVAAKERVTVDPAFDDMRARRGDLRNSLNFDLPPNAIKAGRFKLSLKVTRAATTAELTCRGCADVALPDGSPFEFFEVKPFKVVLVGVRYDIRMPGTDRFISIAPTDRDYDLVESWLKRAYPVSLTREKFSVRRKVTEARTTWGFPFLCHAVNSVIQKLRKDDIAGGFADNDTRYVGLVHDGGRDLSSRAFMQGCAMTPPAPDPSAVASLPTGGGPVNQREIDWDKDGVYGDWYAGHEIGHTFGRSHPGLCGEDGHDAGLRFKFIGGEDNSFVGYDAGESNEFVSIEPRLLPGDANTDLMSYCGNVWLSAHTYRAIFAAMKVEAPPARPAPSSAAETALSLASDSVRLSRAANTAADLPAAAARATRLPLERAASPSPLAAAGDDPDSAQDEEAYRAGQFFTIVATVNLSKRTGEMSPPSLVERAEARSVASAGARIETFPQARVKLKNQAGDLLAEYALPLIPGSSMRAQERVSYVSGEVPVAPGIGAVELYLVGDEQGDTSAETLISRLAVSGERPRLQNLNVRFKDVKADGAEGCSPFEVSWEPRRKYADKIYYGVQLSKDGGRTWSALVTDWTATSLCFTPRVEEGEVVSEIMVRVTISDGVNSTQSVKTFRLDEVQRKALPRSRQLPP